MKRDPASERGLALVVVLAFVVLIVILIVGFSTSMRIDRPAANSHLSKIKASLYAQEGIESAVATLNQFTSGTSGYWVSQPGQLIVSGTGSNVLQTLVPLSSGTAGVSAVAGYPAPNINVTTWRDPLDNIITNRTDSTGSVIAMKPDWIYVTQDGATSQILQYDGNSSPSEYKWISNPAYKPDPQANPIVGRYAYWTDDESSKVNYNLAWGRQTTPPNTNPIGNPTRINLAALTNFTAPMADSVHGFITDTGKGVNYEVLKHGFFNTPEDARQVNLDFPGVAAALKDNKFEVTHYNNDPDTTFFNEPRIVLTTMKSRAGGKPFLDVGLTDVNKLDDPDNMNVASVRATIKMLVSYLKRTDWPTVSGTGSSFQQKYYGSYDPSMQTLRLTQIAINILDYVRCKECPRKIVFPSRGYIPDVTSGDFTLTGDTTTLGKSQNAMQNFLGLSRAPRINEMAMYIQRQDASHYNMKAKAEIHLPAGYGIDQIDLKAENYGMYLYCYNAPTFDPKKFDPTAHVFIIFRFADPAVASQVTLSNGGVLKAGGYVTVSYQFPQTWNSSYPVFGRTIGFRDALYLYKSDNVNYYKPDIVPLLGDYDRAAYYTIDPEGTSEANISSIEVDDPRISTYGGTNGVGGDWIQNKKNTFDAVNSRSTIGKLASMVVPQPPAGGPQLDTDVSGKVSDASLYMPPPAGQKYTRPDGTVDDNTLGVVTSVGELGYIDTGIESTAKAGIPWRTLRLQPSSQPNTVVPDWALMDLFTVPSTVSAAATQIAVPYGSSYGGRVNLNSRVEPFEMDRTLPLTAVLLGASKNNSATISLADAGQLAGNIYNRVLSPLNASTSAVGKQYGFGNGYDSPGEVIEVQGIADQGEASEALVRDIANLVTVRGNVYSVYSIGQSIKQTPAGKLVITGEQRLQSMVERYLYDVDNDPATPNSKVRFRPVYFRNLTP